MKRLVSVFLAAAILISMLVNCPIHVQATEGNAIAIMVEQNSFDSSNIGGDGDSTLLWMKGTASTSGGNVVYTNGTYQAGSIVKRNQIKLTDGFSTYFQIKMTKNVGAWALADGIAFLIYKADEPQLGPSGGGLGYEGIDDSIAVEFDSWNNDPDFDHDWPSHVAIMVNGNNAHEDPAEASLSQYNFPSGTIINAWIDYNGGVVSATVGTGETKGDAANISISRDVSADVSLAGNNVFIGFSSSTGDLSVTHELLKWYFKDSYVEGGLDPAEDTYTQAPGTLSVIPNNAGTNPTSADITIKDDSGNAIANETFDVYIDDILMPEETPGEYDTGAGAVYSFSIPSDLGNGSHTLRVVGQGGVTNFAAFTVNKHTLTYNGNVNTGGTVPSTSIHNDGTTVTVSENSGSLVRTGYEFAGWNTQADGGGTTYHAGSGQISNISSDINLYAVWSKFSASDGNSLFLTSMDAVVIDSGIMIEGFTENISGAKVMIQNKKTGDVLIYTNADGINGTYDSATGVLTLEGNSTSARYQTALRSIEFSTTSSDLTDRNILFSLGGGLYNSENGHFYEYVDSLNIPWDDARTAAEGRSLYGRQGYLTTLTSAEENAFVTEKVTGLGWIGAMDIHYVDINSDDNLGDWRWVTGPESLADGGNGTRFYTGYDGASGTTVTYSNWCGGEPNNGGNIEYVAHIFGPIETMLPWAIAAGASPGEWNDFPENTDDGAVKGYIVEYGGMAGDTPINVQSSKTIDIELAQSGTLSFGSTSYSAAEDGTGVTITVDRTGGSDGSVSVDYATSDDTAIAGSDYTAASGTLTFADGETIKAFTVNINDDAVYEGDETVRLTLSNVAGGAALGEQSTAELTITDNETASPGAPTIQSAVAGDGYVNITWSEVVGSTGYKIYSSTTSYSYEEPLATVSGAVYSYNATSLTNGITYYFAVKATNEGGDSEYSNEVSATPQVSIPGAPELFSPVAGNAQVSLNWSPAEGAMEYTVFSSTNSDSYGSELDTVADSVYSYDATGLTNGITYYFRVRATNPGGSVYSNQVSATPKTVPGAPINVTATAGNRQATVSFTAPADNGGSSITSYTVLVYHNGNLQGGLSTTGTGSPITVTGLTNGTAYTFTVTATNAAGTSAPSSASSAVTPRVPESRSEDDDDRTTTVAQQPATSPQANTGVDIFVNGKAENAGTATTTAEGTQTVTTVAVDEKKLEHKLEQEGNNAVVTIPVNTKSDIIIGELNGQMVKNMETKAAVLEVKTETAAYSLPAQQINIDAISQQVGTQAALRDIKVQVEIARATAEKVQIVENSAKKGEFSIVAPPVEFNIKCTYGNKTVEVKNFNAYVERTIAIPDGIDPNKITTGVIIDPDGTVRHVPTRVTVINGKYYAVINSLTNSLYSVVWHPLEFKDAEKHWAKEAINDMGSRMVIKGVGSEMYAPDNDITRAEFAAIIVRALGLKPGNGKIPFMDVKGTDWYSSYIITATEYKIISGYGNGKFGPMDKISREQAMTMVARAMNITGLKAEFANSEIDKLLASYGDAVKSADYSKSSIAACVKTGIVSGRNGNLIAPKDNITRAEVAVIVRRLLQKSNLI